MSSDIKALEETIETSSIKKEDDVANETGLLGPPSYTVEEENKGKPVLIRKVRICESDATV